MPIIPIIQETVKTGPAPAPVLDNLRRPKVDLSGVIRGQGDLADAARMPELPMSLAAPMEALAGLGQDITRAGGGVGAAMERRAHAKTYAQTHDAETQMAAVDLELDQFADANRTDPDAWEPKRQELFEKLRTRFEGNKDLTPQARERINAKLEAFNIQSKAKTFRESSKAHFQYAKSSAFAAMDNASKTGNVEAFEQAATDAAKNLWAFPHEIEAARQKFDFEQKQKAKAAQADAEAAHVSAEQAIISMDPQAWMKANPKPRKDEDAGTWYKLRTFAEGMERNIAADISEDIGNKIVTGEINSPAQIDAMDAPGLTPLVKQQLKADWAKFDKVKSDLEKAENGDANFVKMWVNLDKIQFKGTPEENAIQFNALMNEAKRTLPDDRAGEVTQRLHAMFGVPGGGSGNVRPPLQRQVTKAMDIAWKGWMFGRLADWDPNLDNGKGKPKGGNVSNPRLEMEALKRRTAAELEMEQFFKANPNADEKAVQAKMNTVLDRNVSQQAARQIIQPVSPPPAPRPGAIADWGIYLKNLGAPEIKEEAVVNPTEPPPAKAPTEAKKPNKEAEAAESEALRKGTKDELGLLNPGSGMDQGNPLLPDIPFNE